MILQCIKWVTFCAAVAFRLIFITWQPSVSNVLICSEHNSCHCKHSYVRLSVPGGRVVHVDKQLAISNDCSESYFVWGVTVCCHVLDIGSTLSATTRTMRCDSVLPRSGHWQHTVSNYTVSEVWQCAATFWTLAAHCQQLHAQWGVTMCCNILDFGSTLSATIRTVRCDSVPPRSGRWQHTVSNYTDSEVWQCAATFWTLAAHCQQLHGQWGVTVWRHVLDIGSTLSSTTRTVRCDNVL